MQADYSVELGRGDETLDVPWSGPNGGPSYHDLKRHPGELAEIEEAVRFPELGEFLKIINSPSGSLESAKCDAWSSAEINPEEEIFEMPWKFGSYVDLLFTDAAARFSFEEYEEFLKKMVALLGRAPEIPASAEFLLRRCYFREQANLREGFYITFYLFGYGEDEIKARLQWAIALKLAGNALAQTYFRNPAL